MVKIHDSVLVGVVAWMLAVTASQAITTYQTWQITNNHLPHIEQRIDALETAVNKLSK